MSAEKVLFVVGEVRKKLASKTNSERAAGQKKYMKNLLEFFGLDAKQQETVFKEDVFPIIKPLKLDDQISIAYKLYESKYGEEKSFAIKILNKNVKVIAKDRDLTMKVIDELAEQFDKNIFDWATCDCTSSRVIWFV